MTEDVVGIRVGPYLKEKDQDAVYFDRDGLQRAGLADRDEVVLDVNGALIRGHVRVSGGNYWLGTQQAGRDWTYKRIIEELRAVGVTKPDRAVAAIVARNGRATPVSDPDLLRRRVDAIDALGAGSFSSSGNPAPAKVERTVTAYERDPAVVAAVLRQAGGRCELCAEDAPFVREDGSPFLEVHHVETLADGGRDTPDNAVALCPNCHRLMHHAAEEVRKRAVEKLRETVGRLVG